MMYFFATILLATLSILPIHSVSSSPSDASIKSVTISGGTHGNEYTGIWIIKAIEKQREMFASQYPTLNINTLLANPKAFIANRRFIDTDLNREFSITKLQRSAETCSEGNNNDETTFPYETLRAHEIYTSDVSNSDVIIDLHTTTANMGITIIFTEGDVLMGKAAAYALYKCKTEYGYDDVYILLLPKTEMQHRTHLPSIGKHDITIEVGPTPQGVIRHDVVEKTESALHSLLDFFHRRNIKEYNDVKLMETLRKEYPNGVPCYQSAKSTNGKALHGKIQWPVSDDNPNFPAVMIHKDLQDRDYSPIKKGDPLFVNLDVSRCIFSFITEISIH